MLSETELEQFTAAVQEALSPLDEKLRSAVPGLTVQPGRNRGEFGEFVYRTYGRPGTDERMVAGVLAAPAGSGLGGWSVSGDFALEDSGKVLVDAYSACCVCGDVTEVLLLARGAAIVLVDHSVKAVVSWNATTISAIICDAELPQWARFAGNNHERLDAGCSAGGFVDLASHVGKPLSQRLWVDLTMRLRVTGLRVYRPGDGQWLDCPSNIAIVELDEAGNVVRVLLSGGRPESPVVTDADGIVRPAFATVDTIGESAGRLTGLMRCDVSGEDEG